MTKWRYICRMHKVPYHDPYEPFDESFLESVSYGESLILPPEATEIPDLAQEMGDEDEGYIFNMTVPDFVEEAILVPHALTRQLIPYSFGERRYLRRVYGTPSRRRLLMCGRQVEKSSFLGNYALALACLVPSFRILYVSPSSIQSKVFSKDRLKEPMETCPVLRTWFPENLTDNVFEKRALNRSTITLRYAYNNADRTRGIPADLVEIDEFQDILMDNIPVIEECAGHSPYRIFVYSGTPKSQDNPIQVYWDSYSTQNEWCVPCERHGTPKDPGSWHWNVLGEENIGRESLVCSRCKQPIDPQHPLATWVQMCPENARKGNWYEGFRVPQLMVPWIHWADILSKYEAMPRAQFFNEVLGRSYDGGQRPLTRDDLLLNCDPQFEMLPSVLAQLRKKHPGRIYAGIDWGQDTTNSYTVLSLGTYIDGRFQYIYLWRFQGAESVPDAQMKIITDALDAFRIFRTGVDYGGGYWPNSKLLARYGEQRVIRYQYSSPSQYMVWDPDKGLFKINRNEVMAAFINAIKRGTVFRFPRAEDFMQPYGGDCLAIFSEYNERTRTTEFKKSPNTTDDAFHSMMLCFLVSMQDTPRPDIFDPTATVDRLHIG